MIYGYSVNHSWIIGKGFGNGTMGNIFALVVPLIRAVLECNQSRKPSVKWRAIKEKD